MVGLKSIMLLESTALTVAGLSLIFCPSCVAENVFGNKEAVLAVIDPIYRLIGGLFIYLAGMLCTAKATSGVKHQLIVSHLILLAINVYLIISEKSVKADIKEEFRLAHTGAASLFTFLYLLASVPAPAAPVKKTN